jgi:hypothetical protein
MTTDKRGVPALLLQRQFALDRYKTARMMLLKFRRTMVNMAREQKRDEVEVDDTWIDGAQAGLRGSRQIGDRKAVLVIVAVEKRDSISDRARMAVIPDFNRETLTAFLKQNVLPSSTICTDGLKSFTGFQDGCTKIPKTAFQESFRSESPLCVKHRKWPLPPC